jgi:NADH-quinone oxidoreductase subunit M
MPDLSGREVAVLVPVLALILVLGIYPKLLTTSIDPSTRAAIQHVNPSGQTTDVGPAQVRAAAQVQP